MDKFAEALPGLTAPNEHGCWVWQGSQFRPNGYGRYAGQYAHRLAYSLFKGAIPQGLQIDHLCRNKLCVNPAHLEAVTGRVNTLRGQTLPAQNLAKTHCVRGHAFTAENTRVWKGERICRACQRENTRAFRRRQRCAS